MLPEEFLSSFEAHLRAQEKARATVEKYMRDIRTFSRFLAGEGTLNKEAVMRYKEWLAGSYKVSSANSMLAALNCFLCFIGKEGLRVKPLKMQRRIFCSRESELKKKEYVSLLEAAEKANKPRLCLLIKTICATGIRVSELRFVTVRAAQKGRAQVDCKGKNRIIFLPQKLCALLLDYAREAGIQDGPVFVSKNGNPLDRSNIWKDMKALCARARVAAAKVFPHNLRHLFARTFYDREKDIARLADVLGHSSIDTTRIYILTSGEEQERRINALGLLG